MDRIRRRRAIRFLAIEACVLVRLVRTFPAKQIDIFADDTFQKIARAQVVEVKVGRTTFELGEKNLAALRDLNNRVKP